MTQQVKTVESNIPSGFLGLLKLRYYRRKNLIYYWKLEQLLKDNIFCINYTPVSEIELKDQYRFWAPVITREKKHKFPNPEFHDLIEERMCEISRFFNEPYRKSDQSVATAYRFDVGQLNEEKNFHDLVKENAINKGRVYDCVTAIQQALREIILSGGIDRIGSEIRIFYKNTDGHLVAVHVSRDNNGKLEFYKFIVERRRQLPEDY